MDDQEITLEDFEVKHQPLGPVGWIKFVGIKLAIIPRILLPRLDIRPIKHFEVKKDTFLGIPTGLRGKLKVAITNPTPFQCDCEFYCRAVGEGFEFVKATLRFPINRRAKTTINYKWHIGFWDFLVKLFLSLFSSETRIHGYIKADSLKRDYDVTDDIPIEKA